MPRVVPSQVVALIDEMFPGVCKQLQDETYMATLDGGHLLGVAALLEVVRQVPCELLALNGQEYSALIASIAALEAAVRAWEARNLTYQVTAVHGFGGNRMNPVTLIRKALALCSDESPSVGTLELNFIQDPALRESLRIDVSATNKALSDGGWKAATVLAGSVVEALLLWALHQRLPVEVANAVTRLITAGALPDSPRGNLEDWNLHHYIEVAAEMKIIRDDTAAQARLAKDFRNLIHPGRALRLQQECNRGTALSAVAAVELVVRDLT